MNDKPRTWVLGLIGAGLALLALALLLAAPQLVRAANLDVCLPPATCDYDKIQDAIDAADPGDTIRVAAGTYNEALSITKSLRLEGGWNAGFTARTPRTSIINGAGVSPMTGVAAGINVIEVTPPVVAVKYVSQGSVPALNAAPESGLYPGMGIEVVIDGFEITGGSVLGPGGGVSVEVEDGSLVIINDNFVHDNEATADGGGIYAYGVYQSEVRITHNRVTTNTSHDDGGGISAGGEMATVVDVTHNEVVSNTATENGGGVSAAATYSGTLVVDHNLVERNIAQDSAGGLELYVDDFCQFSVDHNRIVSNSVVANMDADSGGIHLIVSFYGQGTFDGNRVIGNRAADDYGGAHLELTQNSNMTMYDNLFQDNMASGPGSDEDCGGLYLSAFRNCDVTGDDLRLVGNSADGDLGGGIIIAATRARVELPNLYVFDNHALAGEVGGIVLQATADTGTVISASHATIISNTAAGLAGGVRVTAFEGSLVDLRDSRFERNQSGADGGGLYVVGPTDGSAVWLDRTQFLTNTATNDGGGAFFTSGFNGGAYVTLSYARFVSNTAETGSGGGLYMHWEGALVGKPSIQADHTEFLRNSAGSDGGGAYLGRTQAAEIVFDDSIFRYNHSDGSGGALYFQGGDGTLFSANRGTFEHNTGGGSGGALYLDAFDYGSMVFLNDTHFVHNTATADGGALYLGQLVDGSQAHLQNSVLTDNQALSGGAIRANGLATGSFMWLTGAQINDNVAQALGGGLYWPYEVQGGSLLYIEDNELLHNQAGGDGGGCLFGAGLTEGSVLHFNRNLVNDNVAFDDVGGCHFAGGNSGAMLEFMGNEFNRNTAGEDYGAFGIEDLDNASQVRFWDNQVIGNRAGISGTQVTGGNYGGVWIGQLDDECVLDMRDSQILSNTAHLNDTFGGSWAALAVYVSEEGVVNLVGNTIAGNDAEDSYAGVWVDLNDESLLNMERNLIAANTAVTESGGLAIDGHNSLYFLKRNRIVDNVAGEKGGLWISHDGIGASLWGLTENNLIAGNEGSGIYVENPGFRSRNDTIAGNGDYGLMLTGSMTATAWLSSTIIWGHTWSFTTTHPATQTMRASFSDIQGPALWPGLGNINQDPLFVNAPAGNYHLQETSPAVNKVDPATAPPTDLDGIPRPVPFGGLADMGCYEWFRAGVTLEPDQATTEKPGTVVTYDLTLTNDGNLPDTFPLDVPINPLGWTVVVSPSSASLGPGASTPIQVQVTVPADAEAAAVNNITVRATSQSDGATQDIATLDVTVALAPALSLEPDRAAGGTPGSVVVYEHNLTNLGNGPETFLLSTASSQGWTTMVNPAAVLVAKGASAQVTVYVWVPDGAPEGMVDVTTVTGTSASDATVSDTAADTTTRAAMPFQTYLPMVTRNH